MITLNLAWTANPAAEQIISYDVQVYRYGTLAGSYNTPTNSLTVENQSPGVYSFCVRANNAAGSSAFSAQVTGPDVPSVPTGLVISAS